MGRRIGRPQTPTKAGYSDVFDIRQHQKYVKDNILANPKDDALGSVRFDGTAYLSRTPSNAGNTKTWTMSTWVKRGEISTAYNTILSVHSGGSRNNIYLLSTDAIDFEWYNAGTATYDLSLRTNALLRDVNSWYHIVVNIDTTQATSTERAKIYVNGEQITSLAASTYPSQNDELYVNSTLEHRIAQRLAGDREVKGYLSNFTFVDGLQLDPTYFGYTDRETGQWKPKRYTGNFGTNGFYLPMEINPAIDESGNDNHFTAHNITYNDNPLNDSDFIPVTTVVKLTSSETPFIDYVENLSSGTTEASIEFWIKMDGSYNDIAGFFNFIFPATDLHFDYYNNTNNGFRLVQGSGSSIPFNKFYKTDVSTTTSLLYDGNWHHICLTFESLSGLNSTGTPNVQAYFDGTLMTGTSSSGTGGYADKNFPAIGRGNGYTDGDITEIRKFRIYPKHLSSSQVTTLYNQTESIAHSSFNLRTETYLNNSNDVVSDSPQNTFATLNGVMHDLTSGTGTLSEGNLRLTVTESTYGTNGWRSSIAGNNRCNWYAEMLCVNSVSANDQYLRFILDDYDTDSRRTSYRSNGVFYSESLSGNPTYASWTTGDIIGGVFNFYDNEVQVYKNGVFQGGVPFRSEDGLAYYFGTATDNVSGTKINHFNFGQDHTFAGEKTVLATPYTDANGIGEFYYPPPDGALALCTKNLEGGLSNITTTKKYYNRDETGKVLSYEGYNNYTYGTINDERLSDVSPYSGTNTKSVFFDGTNDMIRFQEDTKTSLIFLHDGSPYTVEFAIQVLTTPPSNRNHVIGTTQAGSALVGLGIYLSDDLTFRIYTVSGNSGASQHIDSTSSLSLGDWHNVALTYDGNSANGGTNTFALYIDGTDVASSITYQNGSSFSHSSSNADRMLTFASDNADTNFWHGRLTNVRISNVVRSGLTSVPTGYLSSDSNTKILFQPYNTETVNNTLPRYPRDEVGKVLEYNRNVGFVNESPYADNSVKSFDFDNTSSLNYIKLAQSSDWTPGANSPYTIEFWYKSNVSIGTNQPILTTAGWSSNFLNRWQIVSNSNKIAFWASDGTGNTFIGSTVLTAGKWYHVAVVQDSSSNWKLYLNGVQDASGTDSGYTTDSYLEIGANSGLGANYGVNGVIADLRIVKGTAVYTGAFTPPSGKLTTTGGTYPSTTNVNTSITASHTKLLAQPYSQPAQIHDVGSTYRTNRIYLTDETGKTLIYA